MSQPPSPVITTPSGAVRGVWRRGSAAFLGIPFAAAPVGPLRFAAPQRLDPWPGVWDATQMGATAQRRPYSEVTTIPEPSIPGAQTLNVNVFTPAPGDTSAKLPVFVWVHGGGYIAGSPASPWYDGRAFNHADVVTVAISYRLGFEGFGWVDGAPSNRGLRDQITALEWVQDNIAAFGGDPQQVTLGGQSAGGGSVLWLSACPQAQPLFQRVIAHSAAAPVIPLAEATARGHAFAELMGVQPTVAGWSALTEEEILNRQDEVLVAPSSLKDVVTHLISGDGAAQFLAWGPHLDGDLLPWGPDEAWSRGVGNNKPLLIGTVAHEFSMMFSGSPDSPAPMPDLPVAQVMAGAGLPLELVTIMCDAFESMPPPVVLGQLVTEFIFRIPAYQAAQRPGDTWLFDFRWESPVLDLAYHCIDVPYAWGLLDAPGVREALGPHPPAELEQAMHQAWVQFITTGNPGWTPCQQGEPGPGMVFDARSHLASAPYQLEAQLAAATVIHQQQVD